MNSKFGQNTRPPNLEKHTSHYFSISTLTENSQQKFLDISPATMVLHSKNLVPNSKESNSSKNPSTHTYPSPQHLGGEEIHLGPDKKSAKSNETRSEWGLFKL